MKKYFYILLMLIFSSAFSVHAATEANSNNRAQELPLKVLQQCATAKNFWVCIENQEMVD
ncbi:hypothetical protein [Photobacterium leiognathi]|uniref:hypothetical protein n=1 Tax=Photobacterium leiognathi TaxID=553611 RepID=UPI002981B61C|nr:hypothetical protein [Photobacterium leiognathi]